MGNNADWILYWGVLYPCLYILWFLILFGSYKLIKEEIKGDEI